jgi:Cu/Ag efflux protein CusF
MKSRLVLRAAVAWVAVAAPAFTLVACGEDPPEETPAAQEFEFAGEVQSVDAARRTVSVLNEDVPGWMAPMTMSYAVTPPSVLDSLRAGDRITATVRSGDVSTLYDVEIVR